MTRHSPKAAPSGARNEPPLDAVDRTIVNALQGGFPLGERPYRDVAEGLGLAEDTLIERLKSLLERGVLSRFGPMYHAEKMGGGLTLAALSVDDDDFARIAVLVNAHPEVAHNYRRDHAFNMWFVIATERPGDIARVIAAIEAETGLDVLNVPKEEEYFIGLRFEA
ncbi:Lrp/AsnC family transcriptional regulator [Varunaivibrio sulfuroxidans]|uniref:siroheme decarboxylase n=1 Tax=Varunaivibrio sulfuroxidans TaxID=1773489 RepID=A0A4R3JAV1_9PROT|nr:AsnC family transcriptional regulator [Varunaivibrio sulfuroxidans]TCS61790.1 AsnC family transcriptional regulator [Varunaivibrio sulfuroxidans]WES32027.1 AsnC family transcriptional regulator [Varunaivibrio sulfuroxidans]